MQMPFPNSYRGKCGIRLVRSRGTYRSLRESEYFMSQVSEIMRLPALIIPRVNDGSVAKRMLSLQAGEKPAGSW